MNIYFFVGKLHVHPLSLEPMNSPSIPLLWGKIQIQSNYDIERDLFFRVDI